MDLFSLASSWTINTQYYTADVSVSVAHLHEDFSIEALPMFNQLDALVMVFDMNDVSPFYLHHIILFILQPHVYWESSF